MSKFQSDLITLADVIDRKYFFNIPIYQRLYVWGKEQINTLLDDLVLAWQECKSEFYLGGTLVIEREQNQCGTKSFDLIDGQQRFTTLWLISVVLKEHLSAYTFMETKQGKRPRISFSIRPQVTEFFEKICEGTPDNLLNLTEAVQLNEALVIITNYFYNQNKKNQDIDLQAFSNFIKTKVQLVLTTVPDSIDLNKLFEVINNRGVQLQHHEILKARLLENINSNDRESYSLVWDACANMNGYIERHIRSTTKIDTVALFQSKSDFHDGQRENLADARAVLNLIQQKQKIESYHSMTLEAILNSTEILTTLENDVVESTSELPETATSIISFSMLLQHVLRIHLEKYKSNDRSDIRKISDKDLLSIFYDSWLSKQPDENEVKQFIELLWEIRYQFDKHVIKWIWIEEKEEKHHVVRNMYVNNGYLQRVSSDTTSDFSLLQSMLYHSQQMTTQYWLTPLLKYLLEKGSDSATLYLQHLDNHLFCSESTGTLIERTYRFLQNLWHKEKLLNAKSCLGHEYSNGTQYPHYWFYKMEYVLYLKLKRENKQPSNFRITSKNSVEHVTPQTPRNSEDQVPASILHNFGNLVLVTRSMNSEMSNAGFRTKKAKFEDGEHAGLSLKLEEIFKNDHWKEHNILDHQNQMIDDLNSYMEQINI